MKDEKLRMKIVTRIWHNRARWAYLLSGILALVMAWLLGQLWAADRSNVFLTTGFLACFAGGVFLLYRSVKALRETETVITGTAIPKGIANSVNIYPVKEEDSDRILPERISFELVGEDGKVVKEGVTLDKGTHPPGQPWQCLNNGNWYYLNYWDLTKKELKPFLLPDNQYFDPAEFANVISMPAHQKLFTERQNLLQQLAPGLMLLGFIASGFFCLVMGG